jgi:hypothetical protein
LTVRPTIEAALVGTTHVVTTPEWNTNVIQEAAYVQEVIGGTNSDKISGAGNVVTLPSASTLALPASSILPLYIYVTGTVAMVDVSGIPVAGTPVTLIFAAAGSTITNGNHWRTTNTQLYTATLLGSITFVSDGTNLVEMARTPASVYVTSGTITPTTANGSGFFGTASISWSPAFSTAPTRIQATAIPTATNIVWSGSVVSVTTGGCTVNAQSWTTGNPCTVSVEAHV